MKRILPLLVTLTSCNSTYLCTADHIGYNGDTLRRNVQMVKGKFHDQALYHFSRNEPVSVDDSVIVTRARKIKK